MSAQAPQQQEHKHYFQKVNGVWTCDCGATRDRHGKKPKARHLHVVGK